jgi:uncharacterized protein (TIGR03663 family)
VLDDNQYLIRPGEKAGIEDRWAAAILLLVAAVARLALLGIKPPHFDEGVNGWFVDQITQTGFYHYDPTNYHGPFHFYVLFLAQTLLGRHIWALRLPLALMSLACVALTLRFDRFIGRGAALWAAAAMAVSPGCVFYGRYAIHEYWLVFSLMLIAWGLAGLLKTGGRGYLWAVWIGVTGAVLTKETYVIHFAAYILTAPCVWLLGKVSPEADPGGVAPRQWGWRDMALGAGVFVGCVLFFYSGGFMDFPGLKGLYQCFGAWAHTGKVGNGHEKPRYYWLKLFGLYEWPSAAGLVAALLCVLPRTPRAVRGLSIYGVGTLVAYSIIHYKTPWCIVSLTWPFLLLFGYGVDFLIRKYGSPVSALAGAVLVANCCDMVSLNFFHFTDAKQPYVYVQTFEDVNKLMQPLNAMVALDAANHQMTGYILMDSYHPLPWMLGDFPNVGYYDQDTKPPKLDADFLMVDDTRIDEVESQLRDSYFTATFTLRDAQDPSKLYLSAKKFQPVFPGRQPDFVPEKSPSPPPPSAAPAKIQ